MVVGDDFLLCDVRRECERVIFSVENVEVIDIVDIYLFLRLIIRSYDYYNIWMLERIIVFFIGDYLFYNVKSWKMNLWIIFSKKYYLLEWKYVK